MQHDANKNAVCIERQKEGKRKYLTSFALKRDKRDFVYAEDGFYVNPILFIFGNVCAIQ
jgi:hypothetical protein